MWFKIINLVNIKNVKNKIIIINEFKKICQLIKMSYLDASFMSYSLCAKCLCF